MIPAADLPAEFDLEQWRATVLDDETLRSFPYTNIVFAVYGAITLTRAALVMLADTRGLADPTMDVAMASHHALGALARIEFAYLADDIDVEPEQWHRDGEDITETLRRMATIAYRAERLAYGMDEANR